MADDNRFQVIVIGGGPAGVISALRARELGAKVALIEKGELGGVCTNDGCAPTRVLAKAARLMRDVDQFESYGIYGERPSLNFSRLMERTNSIVHRLHEKKQLLSLLQEAGVTTFIHAGPAHFVDPHTLELADTTRLESESFIIAVGGHGRRISFPGSEMALTHQDVWSLRQLPKSLAIVGGAATGSQLASIFSAFGTDVHLFEVGPSILGREDRTVAKVVHQNFLERGIHVTTGISGVESIEKADGNLILHYLKDGENCALLTEGVILSVGWIGNIEGLNLEAAGVRTERGYIVVDDYMRTSAENIYAAGDITGRMMLVQSGSYEGRIAAENAVLGPGLPYKHLIVPHGGFTDPEYACVGMTEEQAIQVEPDCLVAVVPYADTDRAVIDDLTAGFCKIIVSQETHRILGAAVVGEQAVELVQIIAAGMASGMWIEQLAELELAYPTFTAIIGLAARRLVRQLGVLPLSAQFRTLGREYAAEWERSDGG